MTEGEEVPAGIDASVATAARIYDYLLGGHDNFAADRTAATNLMEMWPEARLVVRENRAFLGRVVRSLTAEAWIRQFLDLGAGLPATGNVHQVAQAIAPDSRVVYVDSDPMVLAHARALGTGGGVAVIHADLRDVEDILQHPDTRRLIDFSRPLGVLFVAVLHFIPDPEAHAAVARYMSAVAPGSCLALSHGTIEQEVAPELAAQGPAMYSRTANPLSTRPRAQILEFFAGLELIEPGVVPVMQWHPDEPRPAGEVLPLPVRALLGGVGRKNAGHGRP